MTPNRNSEECPTFFTRMQFFSKEMTWVFPVKEKIEDMLNAKSPENVTQLKSFLGMINYY